MNEDFIKSIQKTDYQFNQIKQSTEIIIHGNQSSLLICGRGGLGKTYTINKTLKENKLIEGKDYFSYTGSCTPKALYQKLYEHNGKILVFDDCDEFLSDPKAINILKGALDTTEPRTTSWLIATKLDKNLPDKFDFNGKIIFISNLSLEEIDEALKTRILIYDVQMDNTDVLYRMFNLKEIIMKDKDIDESTFLDCYYLISKNIQNINKINKSLSMRDLIKIIDIKKIIKDKSWEELAIKTLLIK